jgi:pectin-derived oligosaccharide transport system substrate-binding protein
MTTSQPTAGLSRRGVIKAVGAVGAAAGLSACRGFGGGGSGSGDGSAVELNMVWWGDATRAKKTQAALDIFHQKNPSITVKTEYQDSSPYKDKLATRFAAGNPPDLMAMRVDSLREYADRGSLLDLNKHTSAIDLSNVSDGARNLGTVGDKCFGIPSGLNAIGFVVNKAVTDKYGVQIPDGNTWSWDDLAAMARQITAASGKTIYGTGYEIATLANVIVYTRQQGEDFFTSDGKLGISEATLTSWFDLAEKMRVQGGFPPAGFFETIGSSADQSYIARGKVASYIIPTNNFLAYNAACGGKLVLLRIPGESQAKRRGQSVDTPALWSVAAKSKHPDATLKLLNFLTNDVDASTATGTTRGVPANTKVAEQIKSALVTDDQIATDYLIGLQHEKLPRSYTYPPGSSSLNATLLTISTEVEFKRQSSTDGAKAFLAAAKKALSS